MRDAAHGRRKHIQKIHNNIGTAYVFLKVTFLKNNYYFPQDCPFSAILGHSRPFSAILGHSRPFSAILGTPPTGRKISILGYSRPFSAILGYSRPFSLLVLDPGTKGACFQEALNGFQGEVERPLRVFLPVLGSPVFLPLGLKVPTPMNKKHPGPHT